MTNGIYKITEDFEKALSDYTGSPYVVLAELKSRDPEIWGNVTPDTMRCVLPSTLL